MTIVAAVQIIFAAKSRSTYNVDLQNVEELGVYNVAKAIMVRRFIGSSALSCLECCCKRTLSLFKLSTPPCNCTFDLTFAILRAMLEPHCLHCSVSIVCWHFMSF